jgi:hypothetical protein
MGEKAQGHLLTQNAIYISQDHFAGPEESSSSEDDDTPDNPSSSSSSSSRNGDIPDIGY